MRITNVNIHIFFGFGKVVMEISEIQIAVDDLLEIVPEKSLLSFNPLVIDMDEGFHLGHHVLW